MNDLSSTTNGQPGRGGAHCAYCDQVMLPGVGCTLKVYDDFKDGKFRARIPYGEESHSALELQWDQTEDKDTFSYWTDGRTPASFDEVLLGVKKKSPKDCSDCLAPLGSFHHPGCDREECPDCGFQAMTCDCSSEKAAPRSYTARLGIDREEFFSRLGRQADEKPTGW